MTMVIRALWKAGKHSPSEVIMELTAGSAWLPVSRVQSIKALRDSVLFKGLETSFTCLKARSA
eukprot:1160456-Pelagomonas_calceolata.AAC.7